MADILSLGIGQSNLISAVVGRNINTTIGRGGVYNINRENRNNNLYDNLVDALKYGWTENGRSVLGVNVGEDAGINGYASWQKIIDSDSSLYNYTHNENGGRSVYGENDITKRIDNAIDIARYSIHVSQNYNRRIDYFNESERKFSEAYRMGEDSNVIDTGTGGNLNGRLQTLMGNVFGYDLYNLPDDPYLSHYNRIKTNTTVKSNLDELAGKIGKIETITIKDYIKFTPTVANYAVGSVSKLTTGDTEFEALDRLSELYKQSMGGVYKGTLFSVSSDLIKNIREARNIAFQNGGNYLQSVIDDGTFSKGNEFYGESKDYSNSISDSFVGNSIDSSSYSDRVSDISTRYGQKTSISGDSLTNIQIYELYNEDRHIDPGDNVSVSEGGTYGDILELNDKSILKKTNDLFASGKIKSLISRFHTEIIDTDETTTAVDSGYGMSRGRNLRKANVTSHGGYDNPYCRVWTSMHQYSKMTDLIRPFSENGDFASFATIHKDLGGLRTASGATNLDAYSSIEKSGVAHIAPHSEDDVKKCMFSIENLAWKDINFNATIDGTKRTVLSKEQQGPNGGRIMWFPPYNLKFTENVGVQWEGNNFIGRGEQIYTYTNTDRSGTLNFTILVDHPSIIDRWSRKVGKINYSAEQELLRFFAGCDTLTMQESESKSKEEPEESGKTENGLSVDGTPDKKENAKVDRYYVFFPNDFSGIDYADNVNTVANYLYNYETSRGPLEECISGKTYTCQNKNKGTNTWYYQPDKSLGCEILGAGNYKDAKTFRLNEDFASLAYGNDATGETIRKMFSLDSVSRGEVFSYTEMLGLGGAMASIDGFNNPLEYDKEIEIIGYASSHGTTKNNHKLADNRASVIKNLIDSWRICDSEKITAKKHDEGSNEDIIQLDSTNKDINSFEAKLARCVEVKIKYILKENTTPTMGSSSGGTEAKSEDRTEKVKQSDSQASAKTSSASTTVADESDSFDNEYQYFLTLGKEAPLIRKNIVNKVRYFDPAFHSITPEGFNARLTFLHQCTRQGPTTSVSDSGSESSLGAGNLSFGRPPICVLRVGDFYNTKIIIDSLSITYETDGGVQWDMNQEGIGLQPMMADIAIGFKFLGGSDLSGPIARLQNAVSSNFYANTSVYDVRSDYRLSGDTKTMVWTPNFSEGTTNVEHKGYNF